MRSNTTRKCGELKFRQVKKGSHAYASWLSSHFGSSDLTSGREKTRIWRMGFSLKKKKKDPSDGHDLIFKRRSQETCGHKESADGISRGGYK